MHTHNFLKASPIISYKWAGSVCYHWRNKNGSWCFCSTWVLCTSNVQVILNIYLFVYFWLYWVLVACSPSLEAVGMGNSLLQCTGFSCCRAWALDSLASVVAARRLQSGGSVVVVQGLSCSMACWIFLDHGLNPCSCIGRWILINWTTREVW